MSIRLEQLNPHSCRTYLIEHIEHEGSRSVALVDPVLEHYKEYLALIKEHNFQLTDVIDTHTHADHISGAAALKDITECEYVMHSNAPAHCVTFRVHDGFEWKLFGTIPIKVLFTPGHTRDSICLILDGIILTGDTLFLDDGGAGRDDLPGGDPALHWESMKKLAQLPEDLIVYPAHDYRNRTPSSLKQQKRSNPYFKLNSREEFIRYIEDLRLGPADWMDDVLTANYACARDPRATWIPVDVPACEVKGTLEPGVNEMSVGIMPPSILREKLTSANPPVLLDVREKEEMSGELGHIEGIVHIPIGTLTHRIQDLQHYKEREIVTVCRSGGRAYTAAQILKTSGFPSVSVLNGGMIAWNTSKTKHE